MRRSQRAALMVALGFGSLLGAARAEPLDVYVLAAVDQRDAASRLTVELENEGYDVRSPPRGARSPCEHEITTGTARPEAMTRPFAWVEVALDAGANQLIARICYGSSGAALDRVELQAPASEPRQLALSTVEALNGLRARPLPSEREPRGAPAPAGALPVEHGSASTSTAVFASTVLVLQPLGGRPLVGASAGLDAGVGQRAALELEVFLPIRESEVSGLRRELSVGVAFARVGPRFSWQLQPLRFGLSAHAGAALIWATANTEDPSLLGTTELASSALVSLGLWLESPEDSALYVRAATHLSRLLPSIELELGDGSLAEFGELSLEMGLGLGVRW